MSFVRPAAIATASLLGLAGVTPAAAFTNPLQPWSSPAGDVHLLRPLSAAVTTSGEPVGSLTSAGWRLDWNGAPMGAGRMVVRLSLRVNPDAPQSRATEYLQVGVSRAPAVVRTCLTAGLDGPGGRRKPDRVINGRRYAVWTHADAGMSQQIAATDLRTVAGGACYAVARFGYGDSASDRDPAVTLSQAEGAAKLDAALGSLQLGRIPADAVIRPPALHMPPHAVAR